MLGNGRAGFKLLAARLLSAKYGKDLVPPHLFTQTNFTCLIGPSRVFTSGSTTPFSQEKNPYIYFCRSEKGLWCWLVVGCFSPYKHTDVDSYHTPCVHNNYLLLTCIFRSVLESVPTMNRSLSAWIFAFSLRFFLLECGRTSPGLSESPGVCAWWEWVTYSSYYAPCNLMCGFFTCTSVENGGDSR